MQEEKGAVLQEPRLSVKDRIQFFKDLSKSAAATNERQTTKANRNIFQRKNSQQGEQPHRKTEVVKASNETEPVVRRQGSKVGTLISFFSAKIEEAQNERQRYSQIEQRREQRKSQSSSSNSMKYEISLHKKYDSSALPTVTPLHPQNKPHTFIFEENRSYLERKTSTEIEKKKQHQQDYLTSLRDHPTVAMRITDPAPSYFETLYKSDNSEEEGGTQKGEEQSFSFHSPRPGVVGYPGDIFGKTEQSNSSQDSPRQLKNRGPTISEELDTISYLNEKKKIQNQTLEKDAKEIITDMLAKVMHQEAKKIANQSTQFVKEENKAIERVFSEILVHAMVDGVVKEALDDHVKSVKVTKLARSLNYDLQEQLVRNIVTRVVKEVMYEEETENSACREIIEEVFIDQEIVENTFNVFQLIKDACVLQNIATSQSNRLLESLVGSLVSETCAEAIEDLGQEKKIKNRELKEWKQAETLQVESVIEKVIREESRNEIKSAIAEVLVQEQKERKQMRIPKLLLDGILKKEIMKVVHQSLESLENENEAMKLYFQEDLCHSFYLESVRECCMNLLKKREEQLVIIRSVGSSIIENVKIKILQEILEEQEDAALTEDYIFTSLLKSGTEKLTIEVISQGISEYEGVNSIFAEVVIGEIEKLAFSTLMEERKRERQQMKQNSFSFYSSSDVRKKKQSYATADGDELNWLGSLEMSQIDR